jgi:hypothetical protein
MRKISILQENFMALEQKVAEAIDMADSKIAEKRENMKSALDEVFSKIGEGQSFHMEADFINFKNDANILGMVEEVSASVSSLPLRLKEKKVMSLQGSALASKAYAALKNVSEEDFADEIEEVVYFFDRKNTNIPESETSEFMVQLSDAARQSAITKLVEVQSMMASAKETLMAALAGKSSKESLYSALDTFVLLKELQSACSL